MSRVCNVTICTIRKDIKEINDLLKEYDVKYEIDNELKKAKKDVNEAVRRMLL